MKASEFQEKAVRTAPDYTSERQGILHNALGVAGEAGEICDHVKKVTFQGHTLSKLKILEEAGDVLWHLTLLLESIGFTLEEAMWRNVQKLEVRYPGKKFTEEDSVARVDTKDVEDM